METLTTQVQKSYGGHAAQLYCNWMQSPGTLVWVIGEDLRIKAVSQSTNQFFGTSKEYTGICVSTLAGVSRESRLVDAIEQMVRVPETALRLEGVPLQDCHGAERYFDGTVSRPAESVGSGDIGVVLFEVTRWQRKEQLLRQRIAQLDGFVYLAAHDLRAPLVSVLELAKLASDQSPEGNASHLALMQQCLLRMQKLLADLMHCSVNECQTVNYAPVRVPEVIRETIAGLEHLPNARHIRFAVAVEESACTVQTDEARVRMILGNLIANAIHYHDLTKPEPTVEVTARQDQHGVTLAVRDNGLGIPGQYLHKVFNMFYRVSVRSGGSGLGLYIVKEAVEKLGGHVALESTYGQGTRFTITLPAITAPDDPCRSYGQ